MKKRMIIPILICYAIMGKAQSFTGLGSGFNYDAMSLYADSIENKVFAAGNFYDPNAPAGNFSYGDVAYWDGSGNWIHCNTCGQAGGNPSPFLRFKNKLYLVGGCLKISDSTGVGSELSVWENNQWVQIGDTFINKTVRTAITVGDSVMYIAGQFDSFGGVTSSSIVKYDGTHFYAFPNLYAPFDGNIAALAWYKGELYVAGKWVGIGVPTKNIAKWNGTNWQYIGNGVQGSGENIADMIVYDGKLVVAGGFWQAQGNPGNCIATWDGQNWAPMGTAYVVEEQHGEVWDLEIYKGELYAAGAFDFAPSSTLGNLSKWNGTQWEYVARVMGNATEWGAIGAMSVLNGELYFSGNFQTVEGVPASRVAKYSNTTGINPMNNSPFSLYPNPNNGTFTLQKVNLQNAHIAIYNSLGQSIQAQSLIQKGENIEIILPKVIAEGIYFVHIEEDDKVSTLKIMLQ